MHGSIQHHIVIGYTVVGGFLGAGKTTLINAMLATATDRLAIIVNDIGAVNIDAALIAPADGAASPDTIELTNGCVCCSVGDSLASTLRTLCTREVPPDRIVLECSGAADPGKAARYGSRRFLTEPGIVVVVDATDIRGRVDDPRFANLIDAQLESADQLIVSKADLVGEDAAKTVTDWLADRSSAPIVIGHPDRLGTVFPTIGIRPLSYQPSPRPPMRVETHQLDRSMGPAEIESWLMAIDGLVRAKGIVDTANGPRLVQWAAGRFVAEPWHGPMTRTGIVTIS